MRESDLAVLQDACAGHAGADVRGYPAAPVARALSIQDAGLVELGSHHQGTPPMVGSARRSSARSSAAIDALVATLRAKNGYTGGHSSAVAHLSAAIARRLGLDERQRRDVRHGAMLHDIGKLEVDNAILDKRGRLSDEELAAVRQHPVVGERILASLPLLREVRRIVRHHHEAWDGSGYPDGLRGDEIPVGARIVFVADAYHAMTSDRPYRSRLSEEDARDELRACAGTQFDPRMVDALLVVLEPPAVTRRRLSARLAAVGVPTDHL